MKLMLPILLILLALTGCVRFESGSSQPEPEKLNDRQKQILLAADLPDDYDALTPKQQNTITRIEALLSEMEKKYDEEFVYVKYITPELLQSEELICYAKSTGAGTDGKYLVTVKCKDGSISDNYCDFSVVDLANEIVCEELDKLLGKGKYVNHTTPLACNIKRSDVKELDFQWGMGQQYVFLYESGDEEYDFQRIDAIAREYAQFIIDHRLSGTHRFEIYSHFPEGDPSEWAYYTHNGHKYEGNFDLGYYALHINDSWKGITVSPAAYLINGLRRTDYGEDWYPAEDYLSGKVQPEIVPASLTNITYQGKKVFERVHVDWDPVNGYQYAFQEEMGSWIPKFSKYEYMLVQFGWTHQTDYENRFWWERDGHSVGFRIEPISYPYPNNTRNLEYSYELHLEIDGEEVQDEEIPTLLNKNGDATARYYQVYTQNQKPVLKRNEYRIELQLTDKALEKLFGVRLIADPAHWTGTLEPVG